MPKRIRLNGFIGGEITPASVSEEIDQLNNEDIIVDLNTYGGIIYDGLEIFNRIRQYPGNKTVVLGGVVASAGAYISMAFDNIIAQDISTFMIHKAQGGAYGDSDAMAKEAEELQKIDKHLAKIYAKRTGLSEDDVLEMMKVETWFYGKEIVSNGFADQYTETGEEPQNIIIIKKKARNEEQTFLKRVAYAKATNQNNTNDGVKINKEEIQRMDKISKKDLLDRLNVLKENGEITLLQIAERLGLKQQVMTPEAVNALDIVGKLNTSGCENILEEFTRLKKVEDDGKKAVIQNTLTQNFGPAKYPDGKENEARRYASQMLNSGATVENIKEDPIMVTLMAQRADYSSEQNRIGIVTGKTPDNNAGPVDALY